MTDTPPTWLDLRHAAAYCCLSVRTLRRYIRHPQHPLPVRRVGGKVLIPRADLEAWLKAWPRTQEQAQQVVDRLMETVQRPRPTRWTPEGAKRFVEQMIKDVHPPRARCRGKTP
jgi:excisionase family DNA binding protein